MLDTDRKKVLRLLEAAEYQFESTIKMLDDGYYDVDICINIFAIPALLTKVTNLVLHSHISECVSEVLDNINKSEMDDEMFKIVERYSK